MNEQFSEPRPNVIESSLGFSVQVLGRTGMRYTEGGRSVRIDSEVLATPRGMAMSRDSIKVWEPPASGLVSFNDRERIVDNVQRAFEACCYELEVASGYVFVEEIREFLFGQASRDDWSVHFSGPDEVRRKFGEARMLARTGEVGQAVRVWSAIATAEAADPRQALQAWHFVRQAGSKPPGNVAKAVLGVVVEVPVQGGHDLLIAYRDGSVGYLNSSGRTAEWGARSAASAREAVDRWLGVGRVMVGSLGPRTQDAILPLPASHARVTVLTPSGPYFEQGPEPELAANPTAEEFLGAAAGLMLLVTSGGRAARPHA